MFVIHVFVQVKADCIEAFKAATLENAHGSIREPGIARFDIVQQLDDPSRFIMVEAYRAPEEPARHKETPHYQKWHDTVADMMAEPRYSIKYSNLFPADEDWG